MKPSLNTRQLCLVGSMLFGLFFGAGNLIFPLILGGRAGTGLPAALAGLLITAVGIPLLGIVSIGVSRSEGLIDLSGRVSKRFRYLFTCALYLTIGPLFAIPRCGATSFTIGVTPFAGENILLPQLIFTALFFGAVLFFALRPSRILDSVGKFLNPAFLIFLGILLVTALLKPVNRVSDVPPMGDYAGGAFFTGFLQGYDTLDALASLAFGIIVIRTIRTLGVSEPGAVAGCAIRAGMISTALMALIYGVTALVGAQSYQLYARELADPGFNGGDAFAIIARHYFGRGGNLILAVTVTLCCMKTAIGLVTACSETFSQLFPGKLSYGKWALVFTGASLLISNIGLSQIIALAGPVLYFLCPLAITLILLGILGNRFGHARIVYQYTMRAGLAAAVLELVRVTGGPCEPLAEWVAGWLPLYGCGLGWVMPTAAGFAAGLLRRRLGGGS